MEYSTIENFDAVIEKYITPKFLPLVEGAFVRFIHNGRAHMIPLIKEGVCNFDLMVDTPALKAVLEPAEKEMAVIALLWYDTKRRSPRAGTYYETIPDENWFNTMNPPEENVNDDTEMRIIFESWLDLIHTETIKEHGDHELINKILHKMMQCSMFYQANKTKPKNQLWDSYYFPMLQTAIAPNNLFLFLDSIIHEYILLDEYINSNRRSSDPVKAKQQIKEYVFHSVLGVLSPRFLSKLSKWRSLDHKGSSDFKDFEAMVSTSLMDLQGLLIKRIDVVLESKAAKLGRRLRRLLDRAKFLKSD